MTQQPSGEEMKNSADGLIAAIKAAGKKPRDYSGRGMYGAAASVWTLDYEYELADLDIPTKFGRPHLDSMGKGVIAYWPTVGLREDHPIFEEDDADNQPRGVPTATTRAWVARSRSPLFMRTPRAMAQCPSMDRNNPMYECPDDSGCVYCDQQLNEMPHEDSWHYQGFCDAECAARYLIRQAKFADDQSQALLLAAQHARPRDRRADRDRARGQATTRSSRRSTR